MMAPHTSTRTSSAGMRMMYQRSLMCCADGPAGSRMLCCLLLSSASAGVAASSSKAVVATDRGRIRFRAFKAAAEYIDSVALPAFPLPQGPLRAAGNPSGASARRQYGLEDRRADDQEEERDGADE